MKNIIFFIISLILWIFVHSHNIYDIFSDDRFDIKKLDGGLTNKVFLVTSSNQKKYILRIGNPNSICLGIDRLKEIDIYRNFTCNFSNEIYYYDQSYDILLTSFFEGEPIEAQDLIEDEKRMRILMDALRTIHGQKIQTDIEKQKLYPIKINLFYINQLQNKLSNIDLNREKEFLDSILQKEMQMFTPCFCHNDLVWSNLLWKGDDLRIIDWEYSDISDCYFDLAGFCIEHNLEKSLCEKVLKLYFLSSNYDLKKFYLMCCLYSLKNYLWAILYENLTKQIDVKNLLKELQLKNKSNFEKYKLLYENS